MDGDGKLTLTTGPAKYFDLWGIPSAAPELHEQFVAELPDTGHTTVPNGISTHNTLITADELIMSVRSRAVGFAAGRVSATFEEQMEPDDETPFRTFPRGVQEEYGDGVRSNTRVDSTRLLGLGAEQSSQYTAACMLAETTLTAQEVVDSWQTAGDRNEGVALFAVPLNRLAGFANNTIPTDLWTPYVVGGEVPTSATLQPHPVVPWRLSLVQDHLNQRI